MVDRESETESAGSSTRIDARPCHRTSFLVSKGDVCFHCQNQGHWARDCPNKLNTRTVPSYSGAAAVNGFVSPQVRCPCGGGYCVTRTSKSQANPGRKYYACSGKLGNNCGYFRWCDTVSDDEVGEAPLSPHPRCPCGAGICKVFTVKNSGPNTGRKFFVCPVPKGQGACNFFQWQDVHETLNSANGSNIQHVSSTQSTTLNSHLEDTSTSGSELSNEGPLRLYAGNTEPVLPSSVTANGNNIQQLPSPKSTSLNSQREDTSTPGSDMGNEGLLRLQAEETGSQLVSKDAPHFSLHISKVLPDERSILHVMLGKSIMETKAENHQGKAEFWRQISTAGIKSPVPIHQVLGLCVHGWLGRLVFSPSRCLSLPASRRFFCRVFLPFDPIPPDVHSVDSDSSDMASESYKTEKLSLGFCGSGHVSEVSGLNSPPGKLLECNIMKDSILEVFGDAAVCLQHELLCLLQSMDPLDQESMEKEANCTFAALDRLSISYKPFYDQVREFICCASSLARLERTIVDDISSRELVKRYNHEELWFEEISRTHSEMLAECASSRAHMQVLQDEFFCVKDSLYRLEAKLSQCEAETMDLEARAFVTCQDLSDARRSLEAAAAEAAIALELNARREAERREAKAAFEKARVQLCGR